MKKKLIGENLVQLTADEHAELRTLAALSEDDITARALSDADAQPTARAFWAEALVRLPNGVRLPRGMFDRDVLQWLAAVPRSETDAVISDINNAVRQLMLKGAA
jgi:hypothetical protein